ncbi:MAG: helix-turn-helix transcriptional regulator, partial [Gammaproteobacteria bacterium]
AKLLTAKHAGNPDIARRIRILGMAMRPAGAHFNTCADAVLRRHQIQITYHSRGKNQWTDRIVSPQRLVHYRDNWYLDAWCHSDGALRSFAVDRIRTSRILDQTTHEIPDGELDEHFASAFGIFAGAATHTAVLRFTPHAARWVADETWHPQQKGRLLEDGSYELRLPYGNSTELVMDILKYGPEVEVIEPPELRHTVGERLAAAATKYRKSEQ